MQTNVSITAPGDAERIRGFKREGFEESRVPRPGPQQCGPVAGGFQEWIDVAGVLHLHSDYFANFSISLQISATFFPLKRSFLICV